MKKLLFGGALVIIILLAVFFGFGGNKKNSANENTVYQNTISISRSYVSLRLKTEKALGQAVNYPDYNTWSQEIADLIKQWENLELKAGKLEEQAGSISEEKISLGFVNEAQAYTRDEIANVFDKAKAGRKIKTLAKYLGVDARKAYEILKSGQEFEAADWNKTGDMFKVLETSAIVFKNTCKVTGFVGALVVSGGTAGLAVTGGVGAATSAAGAFVATVVGTDLVLEVSGDAATIALGDKNKTTKYISKIRSDSYLEPTAAVLSLTSVPDASKVELVVIQAEVLRSALQDKKILGIDIPSPTKKKTKKIKVSALKKDELKEWTKEQEKENEIVEISEEEMDDWLGEVEIIEDYLDDFGDDIDIKEDEEIMETDDAEDLMEDEGYIDDMEEWLDSFEDVDDWMDELEEEELIEKEEVKKESKEEREDALLRENEERRTSGGGGNKDLSNITFEDLAKNAENYKKKNEERREWLKDECRKIYDNDEEKAMNCFRRGQ